MDDVLKRLLEVEKEAAEMVESAEKEAEDIRERGRVQLAAELETAQAEIESKVQAVIGEREKGAFAQRDAALEVADQALAEWEAQFTDAKLVPVVDAVVDILVDSTQ